MKTIYIFVNGILNMPSSCDAWTDKAVTWIHVNMWYKDFWAEKYEYFSPVFLRRMRQQNRAEKLARMIRYYDNEWRIVLVGHSNGCDVIMRTLQILHRRPIAEIHFVAPAVYSKAKNDLAIMMQTGLLGNCQLYIGGNDKAMKWARISTALLGPFGLGYGDLGGEDVSEITAVLGGKRIIYKSNYDHSTWWERGEKFENTMSMIMNTSKWER